MIQCYAAWSEDTAIIRDSTSGGVFPEIARSVLASGGIVSGAAYCNDLSVEHRIAHSYDELRPLCGVKYVYGKIPVSVFAEMRKALESGKRVLFSGLPCQCAAIKATLGIYSGLLLVDLVCFGTPSQRLWLAYVSWMENQHKAKLININPRDKKKGWGRKTYYRYDWDNGTSSRQLSIFDPYAQAFYSTLGFRKCCFGCRFRGIERPTDITICDCWGVEDMNLGVDAEQLHKGISGVLVHTEKGKSLLGNSHVAKAEIDIGTLIAHNRPIEQSPTMPPRWNDFQEDSTNMEFGALTKKWGLHVSRPSYLYGQIRTFISKMAKGVVLS